METLLILTYTAVCWVIFKVFKLPVNKWTVPTAILGGIIMMGTLILLMNYNHPYTKVARIVVITTPIVPTVKGRVIEVPVEPNVPLKQGDVLFRIEPTIYKAEVQKARAALSDAMQNVRGDKEAWNQAIAGVERAKAERNRAKEAFDRYEEGGSEVFPQSQIDTRRETYLAAEATVESAQAAERRAKLLFEAEIDGENPDVARLRALLDQAEFNLEETTIRAPTDGMVTQLALRPGVMAVPLPLAPVMVFIHKDEQVLMAAFHQNSLQRIHAGDEAEIIFAGLPGKVFKGKVSYALPIIGQGAYQATGRLQALETNAAPGRVPVVIEIEDDLSEYHLPGGVSAEVAIYTHYVHHIAIMRKILFRMKSWQNFLFGEGHGGGGGRH